MSGNSDMEEKPGGRTQLILEEKPRKKQQQFVFTSVEEKSTDFNPSQC
jgi:hypothetical protein